MSKRKKNSLVPVFLAIGGGLLLIAAALLLATQTAPVAPTPVASFEEDTYPEIPRVSLEESKSAYDAGTAVFVDVRAVEVYQGGRIKGAINIPLEEIQSRLGELDKAQWIITYCT